MATLADLLAIPEAERRHEILGGELSAIEGASGQHGQAVGRVGSVVTESKPRRKWWLAIGVETLFERDWILRPDHAGWLRARVQSLSDVIPMAACPDWVCEVLSTDRARDQIVKKRIYHRHRVRHYWLVDPVEQTLIVYRWAVDGYEELLVAGRRDSVRAEPFDDVLFQVGYLFGDDPDDD